MKYEDELCLRCLLLRSKRGSKRGSEVGRFRGEDGQELENK